ncbi:MAG: heavy metal translocating P-type ATPase [Chloroflexi bacterium]|nr:heavy metal translocating P-type ATPase [Chloroflexota bacterium]
MSNEMVFKIEGISCADCAPKIEEAVAKVKGVAVAHVLLGTSQLVIKYFNHLDPGAVVRAAGALGYKLTRELPGRTITLYVEGMDCADELAVIEKKLKGLPAVKEFQANLVNQKLEINFDASAASANDIVRSIAETGLNPRLERPAAKSKSWWKDSRVRLIFVCGFFILVGIVSERLGAPPGAAWAIYAAAILSGGYFPARMAWGGLRTRTLNIYVLLVVATIGAISLGFWSEAAILVFAYTWGAVLETFAVDRARNSLRRLMDLVPREAKVRREGQELSVPVEEIRIGDTVIVHPGEKIPLDGVVSTGSSAVDQAAITGESLPVPKKPGDSVFAASVNQRGALEVKVTKSYNDTTLARIVHSVERAESKKSSYQRFSEQFGKIYTPAIFILAILVALVPPVAFGQPFIGETSRQSGWLYRALVILVVSCSCGLALSVPMAVLASISNGARKGILIKGGADLQACGTVDVVVFDKTGTLTIGRPTVTDIIPLNGGDQPASSLLKLAAAVELRSEHPLAEAILRKAREEGLDVSAAHEFEAIPGFGARASIGGKNFYVCNKKLCEQLRIPTEKVEKDLARLEQEGKSIDLVTSETEVLGILAVSDQLRKESRATVKALRRMGVKRVVMLTGDNEGTAKIIAAQVGVDEYHAQLLPEDKVKAVEGLKQKYGRVAMVGDGVNDAPAMMVADIGIAMGAAGTDVAMETGDLVLMADDLCRVPDAFKLSRRAMANIRQNIVVSLAFIAVVVTLAVIGRINLVPGVVLNEGSALLVMANALRLLRG